MLIITISGSIIINDTMTNNTLNVGLVAIEW